MLQRCNVSAAKEENGSCASASALCRLLDGRRWPLWEHRRRGLLLWRPLRESRSGPAHPLALLALNRAAGEASTGSWPRPPHHHFPSPSLHFQNQINSIFFFSSTLTISLFFGVLFFSFFEIFFFGGEILIISSFLTECMGVCVCVCVCVCVSVCLRACVYFVYLLPSLFKSFQPRKNLRFPPRKRE